MADTHGKPISSIVRFCLTLILAAAASIPTASARGRSPKKIKYAVRAPLQNIEDQKVLNINAEPPHATLMPYKSLEKALACRRYDSTYCELLNGEWSFHWSPDPKHRPKDFYKPSFNVSGWKKIPVPSSWQTEGYGTPIYTNWRYPFKNSPPRVMDEPPKNFTTFKERNPVGSYRRTFDVPAGWKGRRVFLAFDGVDSAYYVWINGEKVGYAQGSRTIKEFDVTKYLKPKGNVLAVEVYR
jgi:beta-galactosidase